LIEEVRLKRDSRVIEDSAGRDYQQQPPPGLQKAESAGVSADNLIFGF
jgi:hypothetical protein